MVEHFKVELEMRRLQKEHEEKIREAIRVQERVREQERRLDEDLRRPLAEGESYIYVEALESVIIPRDQVHRYRFYYDPARHHRGPVVNYN